METISLKLEEGLLEEIDSKLIRHRYGTRTEFIRDAIREKLSDLEKEHIMKEIGRLHGISKRRTTDEQIHIAGEKVFNMLENSFKKK